MDGAASPVNILLAEDNPADVRLVQEAFKESRIPNAMYVTRDGIEALEFLRRQRAHADAPRAGLVLLDLNMPRMDGRTVLAEMKRDEDLKRIPVVVMTSSPRESDVIDSYDHHANCFVRKPVDYERFRTVVHRIENFWFTVATLPPR
jgi:chemotaxis family two-component system response regulator Rcp1